MVLNTQPAELNKIYIYGVLEFEPAQVEGWLQEARIVGACC